MFGLGKKKKEQEKPQGRMVWMIRHNGNGMYLGVCKDKMVHLKNPTNCFRFSDIDAAGIFLYWMAMRKEVKQDDYQVVYALVEDRDGKQVRSFKA